MAKAKYYIYRNLVKGGFSAKRRGLVVSRPSAAKIYDATLQVSEAGQKRVREKGQRNVHAYIVCPYFMNGDEASLRQEIESPEYRPLFYNPFDTDTFVLAGTDIPVHSVEEIIIVDNKAYARL